MSADAVKAKYMHSLIDLIRRNLEAAGLGARDPPQSAVGDAEWLEVDFISSRRVRPRGADPYLHVLASGPDDAENLRRAGVCAGIPMRSAGVEVGDFAWAEGEVAAAQP